MKKIWIGVLSVVMIITGCVTACGKAESSENKKTESSNDISNVYVESEFAPLKRVVLTQSEIYMGKDEQAGNSKEENEEFQNAWEAEREELCKVLKKYGVEVQRPRKLTEHEKELGEAENGITEGQGVTNFFVRDPFMTIGSNLIEGSFRSPYRRLEGLTVRDILTKESNASGASYVAVPQPDVSEKSESDKGPFLEGGDVLVYGKTVFVGNSGLASNEAGIDWLRNYLKRDGYEVVEVKLDPEFLHLDCALSLVREGLMIVCEDALTDGIPEQLKNWDKITVSKEDAQDLATNGLPINENVYVTDIAFKNSVGAELEKRGITVEYIDFKISRQFGGAFRCSTQPLLRVSDSE